MPMPLSKPFTKAQAEVVRLLIQHRHYLPVANALGITVEAVMERTRWACKKIPGDIPDAKSKILVWSRGASLDILEGK